MLDWYEPLYIPEGMKKKEKRTRARIEKGIPVPGVYLLTLSHHPDNVLEMIGAVYLTQKGLREHCPKIVGMASGREEALLLMQRILEETYAHTGTFRVAEYLQDR